MTGTFTSNILYRGKVIERFEEDRIDRNVHVKYTILECKGDRKSSRMLCQIGRKIMFQYRVIPPGG